jgi:hypothetical protein
MALPPGMVGIFPGLLARYGELMMKVIPGFYPLIYNEGWNRARCEQLMVDQIVGKSTSDVVAIVDWNPESQITYGEFQYIRKLLEKTGNGLTCVIADPRELVLRDRKPWIRGQPVDLILNRVTLVDWMDHLEEITDYSRMILEVPEVFVYHPFLWYLADKASLTLLSNPEALSLMGLPGDLIRELSDLVPCTRMLTDFCDPQTGRVHFGHLLERFGSPQDIVIKPVSSHASKGILYGPTDFPSEGKMAERLSAINPSEYVVMERLPPGQIPYPAGEGKSEPWRYDLRGYIFNNHLLFTGGRIYLGEYTNQLPFRYFAPPFFVS